MKKTIVIIGTLDTKGDQLRILQKRIEHRGHASLLMDVSMGGKSVYEGDVTPEEVARLGGGNLSDTRSTKDRVAVTNLMTRGSEQKALELLSEGRLDGIVALGGTTIALLASRVMAKLPFGIPKVIGTPAAMPLYVGKWFGATDLTVMQVIMEIAGNNDLVGNAISQVAGAVCGMVDEAFDHRGLKLPFPSVAITQLGFSDQCAKNVEGLLESKGYHVYPFHAQGISDRAMDRLISQGFFDAVVEIAPAGLVEARFGGNRAADMQRLDAALERGMPQVWAPCCLNLTGVGPTRHNREKYLASGKIFEIDDIRAMTRFPRDELLEGARMYAEKMNRTKGPLALVVPRKGWSSIDREGTVLYDPEEDQLFMKELKSHLTANIEILEVDCNLEDMETARVLVDSLNRSMKEASS